VVVANRSLIEAFQATYGFFSTFGGNAVAAAAGLAVLEVLDHEQLMANAAATGGYLRDQLEIRRQPARVPLLRQFLLGRIAPERRCARGEQPHGP